MDTGCLHGESVRGRGDLPVVAVREPVALYDFPYGLRGYLLRDGVENPFGLAVLNLLGIVSSGASSKLCSGMNNFG